MTGPFRVSRRSWEQLGEVFVYIPAGDCYSSAEDGKLRHTAVGRGKHGTACDLLSRVQHLFPSLREGISSNPSSSNPCGLCPCFTDSLIGVSSHD